MRRPWNIINTPVYSLATYREGQVNMNICTYVTAISRHPKSYIVSIENGSQTLVNLLHSQHAVLQLLTVRQINLVKVLGKRSGTKFNKDSFLTRNMLLDDWKGYKVLNEVAAYLLFEKVGCKKIGDHTLFSFRVKSAQTLFDSGILMFQDLIDQKIILR